MWPDWAIYWTLGNFLKPLVTFNLPKSPTFLSNFCKCVKSIIFPVKSFLGNFNRHLAIFFMVSLVENGPLKNLFHSTYFACCIEAFLFSRWNLFGPILNGSFERHQVEKSCVKIEHINQPTKHIYLPTHKTHQPTHIQSTSTNPHTKHINLPTYKTHQPTHIQNTSTYPHTKHINLPTHKTYHWVIIIESLIDRRQFERNFQRLVRNHFLDPWRQLVKLARQYFLKWKVFRCRIFVSREPNFWAILRQEDSQRWI